MTLALLLIGCTSQVTITPTQDGCTDYSFDDPTPSTIEGEVTGEGTAEVWRTGAMLQQTGLLFDPQIDFEDRVIHLHETWTGGETDDEFCYEPRILIEGLSGKLQVRWYLEDDAVVPYDTVDLESK